LNGITAIGASLGGVLGGAILHAGFAWLCAVMLTALLLAFGLACNSTVRLGKG
jgi:hypothetical protein